MEAFTIKYRASYRFFLDAFIRLMKFCSMLVFRVFIINGCLFFIKGFSESIIELIMLCFFFLRGCSCVNAVDQFSNTKPRCAPEINPTQVYLLSLYKNAMFNLLEFY